MFLWFRLGNLKKSEFILTPSGNTTRRFVGHSKDVLSVAFSADNRQIVSGSRDKTIKLWNTLGVCKYTIQVSVEPCFANLVDQTLIFNSLKWISHIHKWSLNVFVPFFCRMTATVSGFLVCASLPTAATPSLSLVAGTGL